MFEVVIVVLDTEAQKRGPKHVIHMATLGIHFLLTYSCWSSVYNSKL